MAQEEKVLQIRHIIKDQNAELKKTGGIFKLGNLQESDVRNIECVIIDYPKLEYYVFRINILYIYKYTIQSVSP